MQIHLLLLYATIQYFNYLEDFFFSENWNYKYQLPASVLLCLTTKPQGVGDKSFALSLSTLSMVSKAWEDAVNPLGRPCVLLVTGAQCRAEQEPSLDWSGVLCTFMSGGGRLDGLRDSQHNFLLQSRLFLNLICC